VSLRSSDTSGNPIFRCVSGEGSDRLRQLETAHFPTGRVRVSSLKYRRGRRSYLSSSTQMNGFARSCAIQPSWIRRYSGVNRRRCRLDGRSAVLDPVFKGAGSVFRLFPSDGGLNTNVNAPCLGDENPSLQSQGFHRQNRAGSQRRDQRRKQRRHPERYCGCRNDDRVIRIHAVKLTAQKSSCCPYQR